MTWNKIKTNTEFLKLRRFLEEVCEEKTIRTDARKRDYKTIDEETMLFISSRWRSDYSEEKLKFEIEIDYNYSPLIEIARNFKDTYIFVRKL